MISERKFAEKYTSFWNDILPRGAAVSRFINLQEKRFARPMSSNIPGRRRALINELGFRLFAEGIRDGRATGNIPDLDRLTEISHQVGEFIEGDLIALGEVPCWEPSTNEVDEATVLAHRLARFFLEREVRRDLVALPRFAGCGILESCCGDVLAGTTLYEVKSGEAGFRLTDLRQVLTYCTLNHAGASYEIWQVGFVNPRMGVFFKASVDRLVRSAAGISADSLFFETAHFLSSQGISL